MLTQESLAALIIEGVDEQVILEKLEKQDEQSRWTFINERYEGFSGLSLALGKGFKELSVKIIQSQRIEEFVASFKSDDSDIQSYKADLFMGIVNLHAQMLPSAIQGIVEELSLRKKLSLITSMEGRSTLSGIPWTLEGYHNYQDVADMLFNAFSDREENLIKKLTGEILESEEDKKSIVLGFSKTIFLMKKLKRKEIDLSSTIIPCLVGTKAANQLHAEGFVIFNHNEQWFLFVERANHQESGIIGYRVKPEFHDRFISSQDFHNFIQKAIKSTKGVFEDALSYETYTDNTTTSGFLEDEKFLYIPMSVQNPGDCTTASSEGLFLATVFCHLLENGFEEGKAIDLSKQYVEIFFKENKTIEIKDFLKSALETHESKSKDEKEEFLDFVDQIKTHAGKNGLVDDELNNLFIIFDEKRKQSFTPRP